MNPIQDLWNPSRRSFAGPGDGNQWQGLGDGNEWQGPGDGNEWQGLGDGNEWQGDGNQWEGGGNQWEGGGNQWEGTQQQFLDTVEQQTWHYFDQKDIQGTSSGYDQTPGNSWQPLLPRDVGPQRPFVPGSGPGASAWGKRTGKAHRDGLAKLICGEESEEVCCCFCKLLVPAHAAGAFIGQSGRKITQIERSSGCVIQISEPTCFFPGTTDRLCIVSAPSLEGLNAAMMQLVDLYMSLQSSGRQAGRLEESTRKLVLKLVIPKSAASKLIGPKGETLQNLTSKTGCRISLSPRHEAFQERVLMICGDYSSLPDATAQILEKLQGDPHLKEHMTLEYTQEVPLGFWSGGNNEPADPQCPLMSPEEAQSKTKREMVEYLTQAAPKEILARMKLLGDIKNAIKSNGHQALLDAVQEVWISRGGPDLPAELRPVTAPILRPSPLRPGPAPLQPGPCPPCPLQPGRLQQELAVLDAITFANLPETPELENVRTVNETTPVQDELAVPRVITLVVFPVEAPELESVRTVNETTPVQEEPLPSPPPEAPVPEPPMEPSSDSESGEEKGEEELPQIRQLKVELQKLESTERSKLKLSEEPMEPMEPMAQPEEEPPERASRRASRDIIVMLLEPEPLEHREEKTEMDVEEGPMETFHLAMDMIADCLLGDHKAPPEYCAEVYEEVMTLPSIDRIRSKGPQSLRDLRDALATKEDELRLSTVDVRHGVAPCIEVPELKSASSWEDPNEAAVLKMNHKSFLCGPDEGKDEVIDAAAKNEKPKLSPQEQPWTQLLDLAKRLSRGKFLRRKT